LDSFWTDICQELADKLMMFMMEGTGQKVIEGTNTRAAAI
jgi:hypothetical protein